MSERLTDQTCSGFLEALASKEPVPGGGGAAALVGAVGAALASMVANFTAGKKKYAEFEEDIQRVLQKSRFLIEKFCTLIEEDAAAFRPLSEAYGLPDDTSEQKEHKEAVLEQALKAAAEVPLRMLWQIMEAIALHDELATKGSRLLLSDVGVGIACCRAALEAASLNVFVNTAMLKNRSLAAELSSRATVLLESGTRRADAIYEKVTHSIRK